MNAPEPTAPHYDLTVRRFRLDVETLPKYWFADKALLTHGINAQNLFFPDAERFMVRAVHRYLKQVTDPELKGAVKDFIAQEANHGTSHDQALDLLRAQGFRIDGWLSGFKWCIRSFERMAPAWLCLSVTAAVEHFTASVAECWLTEGKMPMAHPDMAALLGWHAAEEIEHKAVAFDVLKHVKPGYLPRMLGMLLAVVFLLLLLVSGTVMLLWQDPDATWARVMGERREASQENIRATRFIERHVGPYLAPDFHPNDRDNLHVAHDYLAQISGRLKERRSRRLSA